MRKNQCSFAHRQNLDGSWDSICYECRQTIATETPEAELFSIEQTHMCPQHRLNLKFWL